MIWPALSAVFSLYVLVNSTMLMPCGPSAVPTGGAGVAAPAGSCRVRTVRIFLATGSVPVLSSGRQPGERRVGRSRPRRRLRSRSRERAHACGRASERSRQRRHGASERRSQLLDLEEVKLDRCLAAEDADQDLDLVA